jgi:hypothetical protein
MRHVMVQDQAAKMLRVWPEEHGSRSEYFHRETGHFQQTSLSDRSKVTSSSCYGKSLALVRMQWVV